MSDPLKQAREEEIITVNLDIDDEELNAILDEEGSDLVEIKQDSSKVTQSGQRTYVAYTLKLPSAQIAALQSIWLELKRLYGANSPDKSGMIQQAIEDWLKRWEGPERHALLDQLLEIRQDTRKRQFRK